MWQGKPSPLQQNRAKSQYQGGRTAHVQIMSPSSSQHHAKDVIEEIAKELREIRRRNEARRRRKVAFDFRPRTLDDHCSNNSIHTFGDDDDSPSIVDNDSLQSKQPTPPTGEATPLRLFLNHLLFNNQPFCTAGNAACKNVNKIMFCGDDSFSTLSFSSSSADTSTTTTASSTPPPPLPQGCTPLNSFYDHVCHVGNDIIDLVDNDDDDDGATLSARTFHDEMVGLHIQTSSQTQQQF